MKIFMATIFLPASIKCDEFSYIERVTLTMVYLIETSTYIELIIKFMNLKSLKTKKSAFLSHYSQMAAVVATGI